MESIEPVKKSEILLSEEEIKKDIKETLKLSPIFELMTPVEQEQLINEEYERRRKYYKGR